MEHNHPASIKKLGKDHYEDHNYHLLKVATEENRFKNYPYKTNQPSANLVPLQNYAFGRLFNSSKRTKKRCRWRESVKFMLFNVDWHFNDNDVMKISKQWGKC